MDIEIAFPIQVHLLVVIASIILGMLNLYLEKGTRFHKINGKRWACLMLTTAFSSFFIMPTGSLTWLHLFAVLVIASVLTGVLAIRNKNTRLHINCMFGAYIGTIISAVVAASIPGRLLHNVLF